MTSSPFLEPSRIFSIRVNCFRNVMFTGVVNFSPDLFGGYFLSMLVLAQFSVSFA
jgi:acyl-CoA hydrolase